MEWQRQVRVAPISMSSLRGASLRSSEPASARTHSGAGCRCRLMLGGSPGREGRQRGGRRGASAQTMVTRWRGGAAPSWASAPSSDLVIACRVWNGREGRQEGAGEMDAITCPRRQTSTAQGPRSNQRPTHHHATDHGHQSSAHARQQTDDDGCLDQVVLEDRERVGHVSAWTGIVKMRAAIPPPSSY